MNAPTSGMTNGLVFDLKKSADRALTQFFSEVGKLRAIEASVEDTKPTHLTCKETDDIVSPF